tara:strand:- start:2020 stop:3651 length:1632 start_codon:yes stop_codon:yes gene_type:complete
MSLSKVLLEGRREEFLTKYKSKFNDNDIKKIFLLSRELSSNQKFLNFLGKVIAPESLNDDLIKSKIAIERFIKFQKNLEQKDINQYNTLKDISDAIENHENKVRRDVKKINGADIIYEDDRFTVISPKTHDASCYYGAGSKWCTAAKSSETHFQTYNRDGKLFYFLDKKAKSGSRFYKVALLQKFDGNQTFFDAPDKSFKTGWILETPEFEKINNVIQKYMYSEYENEIELFKDKVKAKQEVERLRIRDDRMRRERLLRQMNDIRERDAWNPDTNELDDIGRNANAVMSGLRNEWLVGEIGEDEDIYNLIPETNNFYPGEILSFKWVGENETDSEYIVGEWDDIYELAKSRLSDLIDDVGLIDSFNEDYLMNYVDADSVARYFEDWYDDYVRDDWESIFDKDELPLSTEQKKKHEELDQEIEELYRKTRDTDSLPYSSDERGEIYDKIEVLEEERDEIIENPEGEPTEEMIELKVDEFISEVRSNPQDSIKEYELDIEQFLNKDELIEDAVDTDGVGHTISNYDGIEYDITIDGRDYYVFRTD